MPLIDVIVGARPNFVKVALLLQQLKTHKYISYRLIHTGQHFDKNMSDSFFKQLNIPDPDINFNVKPGSQAQQTGDIMVAYEKTLSHKKPDLCLVVGDVNSTMACAITAQKCLVPVAHIEAGIRSKDWRMPEEINRLLTDAISDWYFTTSIHATKNLITEGVKQEKIFFVGNTMIDTLFANITRLKKPAIFQDLNLKSSNFIVLTIHRPSNVDNMEIFLKCLKTIHESANNIPIIYPVHPRTTDMLKGLNFHPKNFYFIDPMPYLEFNYLIKHAKVVITDSGGISEETSALNVPCITLRENTERPETVEVGTNELAGESTEKLRSLLKLVFQNKWKTGSLPERWDGKTSQRIIDQLEKILGIQVDE